VLDRDSLKLGMGWGQAMRRESRQVRFAEALVAGSGNRRLEAIDGLVMGCGRSAAGAGIRGADGPGVLPGAESVQGGCAGGVARSWRSGAGSGAL
jgi:hypothetical protein